MKNNVWYLTKQRFNTMFFHTGRIITFVILTVAFLVVNLISLLFLKTDNEQWLSNVMIIVASAIAAILMVSLTISMFRGEVASNQVNLELRQGYKPKQIYMARIIEMIFVLVLFMIIAIIVNMITIGVKGQLDSVIWYHMFVTSLGWYALVIVVAFGMGAFFSAFLNSGMSGTIVSIILLIIIVVGGVIPGAVYTSHKNVSHSDDYAGTLLTKDLDSHVMNFAMKDLGIYSEDQWKNEVVDKFYKPETVNGNDGRTYTAIDTDNYKTNINLDYQTYFSMISGDWSFNEEEVANGNIDRQGIAKYSDDNNAFAAFAAFGNLILKDKLSSPLSDFFDASHEFFSKENENIKFDDIENWDLLSGKKAPTKSYSGSYVVDGKEYKNIEYEPKKPEVVSHEKFAKIMKDASDSKLGKKYSFIKDISAISDPEVLSLMHNDLNWLSPSNMDMNRRIYPVYALGGNAFEKANIQNQIKSMGITPAELIFNRNVMYFIAQAFTRMDDHAKSVDGQTVISRSLNVDSRNNKIVLRVQNESPIRIKGRLYGFTNLKYGKVSDDVLSALRYNVSTNGSNDGQTWLTPKNAVYMRSYKVPDNGWSQTVSDCIVFDAPEGAYLNSSTSVSIKSINRNVLIADKDTGDLYDNGDNPLEVKALNPWLDKEPKVVLSALRYDTSENKLTVDLLNGLANAQDDLNSLVINNDKNNKLDFKSNGADYEYVATVKDLKSDKLTVSSDDKNINLRLVDGSLYKPSFKYGESNTHKSAISWIYNPLTQLEAMFNGVNYKHNIEDNLASSYLNQYIVGINTTNVKVISTDNGITMKRNSFIEIVYVYYAIIEGLFVFAGYWIYKKSIVS